MSRMRPLTGPGSPMDEDDDFAFMELPKGMQTYSMPHLPETSNAATFRPAFDKLETVLSALRQKPRPGSSLTIDLYGLDRENRRFIDEMLCEGEVSVIAGPNLQAQEAVFAGVWRIHEVDASGILTQDRIEVGEFPQSALKMAQDAGAPTLRATDAGGEDLMNAPALAAELAGKLATFSPESAAHVINLSHLPVSDGDLAYLESRLGQGPLTILSRGYGNCRISSTAVKNVWWVRYFNSRETLILNSIEVARIPSVACAAKEDLEDSAERLAEILEVYR